MRIPFLFRELIFIRVEFIKDEVLRSLKLEKCVRFLPHFSTFIEEMEKDEIKIEEDEKEDVNVNTTEDEDEDIDVKDDENES